MVPLEATVVVDFCPLGAGVVEFRTPSKGVVDFCLTEEPGVVNFCLLGAGVVDFSPLAADVVDFCWTGADIVGFCPTLAERAARFALGLLGFATRLAAMACG